MYKIFTTLNNLFYKKKVETIVEIKPSYDLQTTLELRAFEQLLSHKKSKVKGTGIKIDYKDYPEFMFAIIAAYLPED